MAWFQMQEPNRLPGTDCAYTQWGHWQFGVKKCGVFIMERGKVIKTDRVRLWDGQHMKGIDETGYTYSGILETEKEREQERNEEKGQRESNEGNV